MSNKRHQHKVNIRFKETPKAPIDKIEKDGKLIGIRKVDHCLNGALLHPTKGWRTIRKYEPLILLNSIMLRVGVVPMEPK